MDRYQELVALVVIVSLELSQTHIVSPNRDGFVQTYWNSYPTAIRKPGYLRHDGRPEYLPVRREPEYLSTWPNVNTSPLSASDRSFWREFLHSLKLKERRTPGLVHPYVEYPSSPVWWDASRLRQVVSSNGRYLLPEQYLHRSGQTVLTNTRDPILTRGVTQNGQVVWLRRPLSSSREYLARTHQGVNSGQHIVTNGSDLSATRYTLYRQPSSSLVLHDSAREGFTRPTQTSKLRHSSSTSNSEGLTSGFPNLFDVDSHLIPTINIGTLVDQIDQVGVERIRRPAPDLGRIHQSAPDLGRIHQSGHEQDLKTTVGHIGVPIGPLLQNLNSATFKGPDMFDSMVNTVPSLVPKAQIREPFDPLVIRDDFTSTTQSLLGVPDELVNRAKLNNRVRSPIISPRVPVHRINEQISSESVTESPEMATTTRNGQNVEQHSVDIPHAVSEATFSEILTVTSPTVFPTRSHKTSQLLAHQMKLSSIPRFMDQVPRLSNPQIQTEQPTTNLGNLQQTFNDPAESLQANAIIQLEGQTSNPNVNDVDVSTQSLPVEVGEDVTHSVIPVGFERATLKSNRSPQVPNDMTTVPHSDNPLQASDELNVLVSQRETSTRPRGSIVPASANNQFSQLGVPSTTLSPSVSTEPFLKDTTTAFPTSTRTFATEPNPKLLEVKFDRRAPGHTFRWNSEPSDSESRSSPPTTTMTPVNPPNRVAFKVDLALDNNQAPQGQSRPEMTTLKHDLETQPAAPGVVPIQGPMSSTEFLTASSTGAPALRMGVRGILEPVPNGEEWVIIDHDATPPTLDFSNWPFMAKKIKELQERVKGARS